MTELMLGESSEYMRGNLFANTPDILPEYLQIGGRPAFMIRLVLAATLGATYGIYGPPFEQCVGTPVRPGSEEYLDSEKYQVRHWDLDRRGTLKYFIARINTIRRDNRALHFDRNLRFFHVDNPQMIVYGKSTPDNSDLILVVVNLDPHHVQSGWVQLPFWEWLIREVWDRHPDTIFLSEAFTRPKVMKYLAKSGFSQSYSYFTWRTDKHGLMEYFTELTTTDAIEYMRPNLFANTPDILHESLQTGGRPGFQMRLVLAATLGATYGIYGPPFEQCVGTPLREGSEEYLDSEKYQLRHWDLDRRGTLKYFIARINTIRRDNPALHYDRTLRFFHIDNPQMIVYGKATPDNSDVILVVVNLDPNNVQSGWVQLPFWELGLEQSYQVHDLLSDARYDWHGEWNFVRLDPQTCPAHIFRVWR